MRHFRHSLILLAMASSFAVAGEKLPSRGMAQLQTTISELNLFDPESDARQAIVSGDIQFIGINGYSCEIPGLDHEALQGLTLEYGVNCLAGTSDVIESPEFGRLQDQARAYAIRYNRALLMLIQSQESSNNSFKPKPLRGSA